MTAPPPDLWNTERVAQYIGMSKRYVEQLVRTDRIPVRRFGRSLRFIPEDIEQWVRESQKPALRR